MKKALIALLLIILSVCPVLAIDIKFDNFVADEMNILSTNTKNAINEEALELQNRTGADIAVVILDKKSLRYGELSDLTREIGRKYEIGSMDKNEGVILAIVPDGPTGNRARIEVGYGLEGVLTDGKCGRILDDFVMPYYENGQYDKAIKQGFDAINNELNKYYENPQKYKKEIEKSEFINSIFSNLFSIFDLFIFFVIIWFINKKAKKNFENKSDNRNSSYSHDLESNTYSSVSAAAQDDKKAINENVKKLNLEIKEKLDKVIQHIKNREIKSSILSFFDFIVNLFIYFLDIIVLVSVSISIPWYKKPL